MDVKYLLFLAAFSALISLNVLQALTTVAPLLNLPTESSYCADCSYAGICQQDVSNQSCSCKDGFFGPKCQYCNVCHNLGVCSVDITSGTAGCSCRVQSTYGPSCASYIGDYNRTTSSNVALNRSVVQCQSGDVGTDLGNSKIWSQDICYNLTINNTMIVDLGGRHQVYRISIKSHYRVGMNVSVFVGTHLAGGCSVMNAVHCTNFISLSNGSVTTSPCNGSVSGRYVQMKNSINRPTAICLHHVYGTSDDQSQRQATFTSGNHIPTISAVLSFKDLTATSVLSCAQECMETPVCINFRWSGGSCSLYGGSPPDTNSSVIYRLVDVA